MEQKLKYILIVVSIKKELVKFSIFVGLKIKLKN